MNASQVLQKKSLLVASLTACFLILIGFNGGSRIFAADFAIDKGSTMYSFIAGYVNAGGDLYTGGGDNSVNIILITPSWTHFVLPHFGFGGDLLLLHITQGGSGSTLLGVGPKASYFFGREESKMHPFLTTGFYYVSSTQDYGSSNYTTAGSRFKFGGGMNFLVSSHLGILTEISYNIDHLKPEKADKSISGNMLIISIGLAGFSF